MFGNQIMSVGEKFKKIRQILDVTQDAVAEGICTKNRISQIENGKKKPNFNLAIGISINFNKIAHKKNIDISLITAEFLLKDENNQANDIFNIIILELETVKSTEVFKKKLEEAEFYVDKYSIVDDEKIKLYKLAADFYYKQFMHSKSEIMCIKGLKICFNPKYVSEEVNFYIYRAKNNIVTGRYDEALEQLEYAEQLNINISKIEFRENIFWCKALIYKKIGEYSEAIKCLKILRNEIGIKNKNMLLKTKMLYANCLNDLHEFEESEKEYIEVLDEADRLHNIDYISLTYRNLSELFLNKKNYIKAEMYIKESIEINPNNGHLNRDLYFAVEVLEYVNKDVEPYLLKALELSKSKDIENLDLIKKIINKLVSIYIKKDEEKKIEAMIEMANELNINCNKIYAQLIKYYRYRNQEKSEYFNNILIEKS